MTAYLKTETLFVILPDTVFLFHLTSWCLRHSAGVKLILQKQTNKIHTYKFLYLYCNSSVDCTISSIIFSLHTQYIISGTLSDYPPSSADLCNFPDGCEWASVLLEFWLNYMYAREKCLT